MSDVAVPGYGMVDLSTLKDHVYLKLQELAEFAGEGRYDVVHGLLTEKMPLLLAQIQAIIDAGAPDDVGSIADTL